MGVGYGKLLLFGEHAAVYGYPAVGIRLARSIELSAGYGGEAESAERALLTRLPEDSRRQLVLAMERLPGLLRSHFPALSAGLTGQRACLTAIAGTLPMSLGFGSSAAFCTGIIRTLLPEAEADGLDAFWLAAHELEHVFHGRPSGIDTALATFPGASLIRPQTSGMPSRAACALPAATLVVGAVARERTTAQLIARLGRLRERFPGRVQARIERLDALAEAATGLTDARAFGRQADQAHEELAALELSSGNLEAAISLLRDAGALGAKLSGAGGGGAFFGVFGNAEDAKKAAVALERTAAVQFTEVIPVGPDERA